MTSIRLSDADHAYPLYYAVRNRIQKKSVYKNDVTDYFSALSFMISPVAQFMVADQYASSSYIVKSEKNANKLLRELALLDTDHLQKFIYRMKANVLKMQHVHAMQYHHYDDTFPLFIDSGSALQGNPKAAFIPSTVIDCDGINHIYQDALLKDTVIQSVNQHLSLSNRERAVYLDHISEVRDINSDDCKKDNLPDILMGQRGVFARRDLPEHFFIGFYSGVYFDVLTDIVPFHDVLGVGVELYLFGVIGQEVPFTSAYRFGNRISLVNSCTNYAGTAQDIAYRLKHQRNCLPMQFKTENNPNETIRNNPNAFDINGYVTTRPIKAGEQIFVDYGYNYWRNKTPDFTNATPEEIAEAMQRV